MKVITQEDFIGKNKKCSYVLAYFINCNLNIGDEWNTLDYMRWIWDKHEEFHKINKLPECVTYWKGHNENLLEKFLVFIGFKNGKGEPASADDVELMILSGVIKMLGMEPTDTEGHSHEAIYFYHM